MSKYLELVEVSEGVVVLRGLSKDVPSKIEFSSEVKTLLNGMSLTLQRNDQIG